ncbi:transcription elongation factor TFIIS [Coemansia sp. Benny D115]|nr:transcription elongation factor TFIIS [Coemansia sp. Benny D115]
MSEAATKHEELQKLCKALTEAQEAQNKNDLTDLLNKLMGISVVEKLLRATGAGQVVGRLRNHEDAAISVLAKKVVQKWKRDVMAANARDGSSASSGTAKPVAASASAGKKQPAASSSATASGSATARSQSPQVTSATPKNAAASSSGTATPVANTAAKGTAATAPASAAAAAAPASANNGSSSAASQATSSAPRTAASDEVSLKLTGDDVRDKCIELLYNSLAAESNSDAELLVKRASGIEAIEFEKAKSVSTGYRARIRSLCLNLRDKKNPELRNNVIEGEISVERFCSMSSEEMASKELKETIDAIKKENMADAQAPKAAAVVTDQFKCGRCKKRKCTYFQMQTRSADEPMTTFVTCLVCDNKWKFS